MTRSDIQILIDAIQDDTPNTALEVRTVLEAIADGVHVSGDTKCIEVSTAYIAANFDPTGLGINERLGWKILNGNNGTRNWGGRVPVGYDTSLYPTLGATGGSSTHTLTIDEMPEHSHIYKRPVFINDNDRGGNSSVFSIDNSQDVATSNTGGNDPHNNMQPYIVTLIIVKI